MNERKVFVRDYALNLTIGVYEHEQANPQPVLVSVELFLDADHKPQEDRIDSVLNYEWIPEVIERVAAMPSMQLVETFGDHLVSAFFQNAQVRAVRVRIEKTQILANAAGVGFETYVMRDA